MSRTVKISEARKTLFELVDEVTSSSEGVVWIEHRDRAEGAALVSARYLRSLQTRIEEMRRHTSQFKLAGSMRLVGTAEALDADLEALRGEQAELADARFRDL